MIEIANKRFADTHHDVGDSVEYRGRVWMIDEIVEEDGDTFAVLCDEDGETDDVKIKPHEFVNGHCACGKACPDCKGSKVLTHDYYDPKNQYGHGQSEVKCSCSL